MACTTPTTWAHESSAFVPYQKPPDDALLANNDMFQNESLFGLNCTTAQVGLFVSVLSVVSCAFRGLLLIIRACHPVVITITGGK